MARGKRQEQRWQAAPNKRAGVGGQRVSYLCISVVGTREIEREIEAGARVRRASDALDAAVVAGGPTNWRRPLATRHQ